MPLHANRVTLVNTQASRLPLPSRIAQVVRLVRGLHIISVHVLAVSLVHTRSL